MVVVFTNDSFPVSIMKYGGAVCQGEERQEADRFGQNWLREKGSQKG
jgi:hypothetical protein